MIEVEAKLAAPSREVLDAIAAREEIAGFSAASHPIERLETAYLDTPARALRAAHVAVRIRRAPRSIELTVKRRGEEAGGVHRRPEWTTALSAVPAFPWRGNAELLAELGAITLDGALSPVVETIVRRRVVDLRDGRGTVAAEVDLDEVSFRRPGEGGESPSAFEVEIELRDGDDTVIARIVESLRRDYALEPARLSKLERALRWAGLDR